MKKDSYRVRDIDGFLVVTETGEEIGLLKDVLPTGANDVFVVKNEKREYLLPARHEVILDIDEQAKKIVVRFPPGLREIYDETQP